MIASLADAAGSDLLVVIDEAGSEDTLILATIGTLLLVAQWTMLRLLL